jgi:uncharacterized protein (DUF1778 family)
VEKTARIALRASVRERELLYEASRLRETTLSEFVLGAATAEAQNVLADRARFELEPQAWQAFVEALDRPPTEKPKLRRLLDGQARRSR